MVQERKYLLIIFLLFCTISFSQEETKETPVRIAVIGLTHTHVHWILGRTKNDDIEILLSAFALIHRQSYRQSSRQRGNRIRVLPAYLCQLVV